MRDRFGPPVLRPSTGVGSRSPGHGICSLPTQARETRTATAKKGENLTALVAERIGRFLYELAQSPLDETFPF